MPQPNIEVQPRFRLGEMVLYEDCIVRIMGREQYFPFGMWFYLLGSKVGKHKMVWHKGIAERALGRPCLTNVEELRI